jgi:hypothetical protein
VEEELDGVLLEATTLAELEFGVTAVLAEGELEGVAWVAKEPELLVTTWALVVVDEEATGTIGVSDELA